MRQRPTRRRATPRLPARIGGIAAVPLHGPVSSSPTRAGPFDDYRALVCVFMYGGNDAHNMIVPLDARYATYAANRGPLALPQASLQPTRSRTRCRGRSASIRG